MNKQNVPPLIGVLLTEPRLDGELDGRSLLESRALREELARCGRETVEKHTYLGDDRSPVGPGFIVTPTGVLDPLSEEGKCRGAGCRLAAAENFARAVCLYADTVVLPDLLSTRCARIESLPQKALPELSRDIAVLRKLEPLISAGVIRFSRGAWRACAKCRRRWLEGVKAITDSLADEILPDLELTLGEHGVSFAGSPLYGSPIVVSARLTSSQRRSARLSKVAARRLAKKALRELIPTLTAGMGPRLAAADALPALLASGSELEVRAIRHLDSRKVTGADASVWLAARSASLPWIRDLTVSQVLRLRTEAARALPALRGQLATLSQAEGGDPEASAPQIVSALRAQAVEVEAELRNVRSARGRVVRDGAALAGLGLTIWGVAAGVTDSTAAIGLLLSLLGVIHPSESECERDVRRIKARPAYALVRARELLCDGRASAV